MPARSAKAIWNGKISDGSGTMHMASGAYEGPYSVPSRFEDGDGTNPEELIAAAHAGCFSMAFSGELTRNGTPPTKIETNATVHINKLEEGWRITKIELNTEAVVPGINDADFQAKAKTAKENCPVSKALGGVNEIVLTAKLIS
ncbi:MAG: OsmC family protein [Anaerolineae bacterium]|nr:OsmC family protein [Anaerolineae bacterium]